MAQTGYTPIQLYYSTTASAVPTAGNLASGELAINITDGKLYYKNNSGTVTLLAGSGGGGPAAGSNTQIQFNNSGVFGASSSLTWDGTYLTAGSIKDSALTSGRVTFAGASGLLTDDADLTFDGTTLSTAGLTASGTVTLSGGTANGVTYLNGSKVLTSGSALTYDGTKLQVNSSADATAGLLVKTFGAAGGIQPIANFQRSDALINLQIGYNGNSGDSFFGTTTNHNLYFISNNTEVFRATSTSLYTASGINVGIGTSSPRAKLEVTNGTTNTAGEAVFQAYIVGADTGSLTEGNVTVQSNDAMAINKGGSIAFGGRAVSANTAGANWARIAGLKEDGTSSQYNGYLQFATRSTSGGMTEKLRLDSAGNLGLGTAPSAWTNLKVLESGYSSSFGSNIASSVAYVVSNGIFNSGWLYKTTGSASYYRVDGSAGLHAWYTAASGTAGDAISFTQAMTLNASGNLGIGTSSPVSKLQAVDGDITVTTSGSFSGFNSTRATIPSVVGIQLGKLNFSAYSTGTTYVQGASIQSFSSAAWSSTSAPSYLSFQTTASGSTSLTERMVIDSAGNLGLGVTPSAWGSNTKAIQVANASIESRPSLPTLAEFTSNGYYDNSNWRYISNGQAAQYGQYLGGHAWYTAPSGTAGDGISFTQAMTLNASENLGVGTTSPTGRVDAAMTSGSLTGYSLSLGGVEVGSLKGNSTTGEIRIGGTYTNYFPTFYSSGTERARIDSSGTLSLRDAPASNALQFGTTSGGVYSEAARMGLASGALTFFVGSTVNESARIDSSGNFLVGTTSQIEGEKLGVLQTANAKGFHISTNNASFSSSSLTITASRNTTNSSFFAIQYYNSGAGANKFLVADSGNVLNTNNSYGAISDAKLKENIVDATPKLADLMQVKVRNYNLIGDTAKQLGVVAQELEAVFPAMVDESPDRDAEGNDLGTTTKAVKYSVFVPMLIKALQEQQVIIESLKARLDAANL